jgi:hypothetical protein
MSTRSEGDAGAAPIGPAGAAPGAAHGESSQVRMTLGGKPSGLRNPSKAMRGLASGALFLEAIVMLLAIQPIRVLSGGIDTVTIAVLVGGAAFALLLTGLLRHNWAWWLGSALQVGLVVAGFLLHWAVGAVGVMFGLVWLYVLHVRRTVLR